LTVARLSKDSPAHGKLLHHDGIMNLVVVARNTAPLQSASCHAAIGVARGAWVTVPAKFGIYVSGNAPACGGTA